MGSRRLAAWLRGKKAVALYIEGSPGAGVFFPGRGDRGVVTMGGGALFLREITFERTVQHRYFDPPLDGRGEPRHVAKAR